MTDKENIVVEPDNPEKGLSEVTPEKKKKGLFRSPGFHVALFLVVMFLFFGWISKHSKGKEKAEGEAAASQQSYTLKQNLEQIQALKKKEEQEKAEEEQNRIRAVLAENARRYREGGKQKRKDAAPPKLRERAGVDKETLSRMKSSTTFLNVTYNNEQGEQITNQGTTPGHVFAGQDGNSQFMNADNAIGVAKASQISHPEYTVAAGEMIEAILETAIDSELPGMVRAVTTRDIYSLNGTHRLIPKGSEMIGQYASGNINDTQTRVLVSWTRVRLPNGIIATINSPSTDTLGRSGQGADVVNRHFLAKFGSSTLFSVLGAATSMSGVNSQDRFNAAQQYRMSVADSFQRTASDYLNKAVNIQPTLKVYQGTKINVFVARDVSFYEVLKQGGLI